LLAHFKLEESSTATLAAIRRKQVQFSLLEKSKVSNEGSEGKREGGFEGSSSRERERLTWGLAGTRLRGRDREERAPQHMVKTYLVYEKAKKTGGNSRGKRVVGKKKGLKLSLRGR